MQVQVGRSFDRRVTDGRTDGRSAFKGLNGISLVLIFSLGFSFKVVYNLVYSGVIRDNLYQSIYDHCLKSISDLTTVARLSAP